MLLGALLAAVVAPVAGLALNACGVSWTFTPFVLEDLDTSQRTRLIHSAERTWNETIPPLFPLNPLPAHTAALNESSEGSRPGVIGPFSENPVQSDTPMSFSLPLRFWVIAGLNLFLILWLMGTLIQFGRLLRAWWFIVRFKGKLVSVRDQRTRKILHELGRKQGIRRVPPVYQTGLVGSPFTLGLVKPCVVLPESLYSSLSDKALRAVIAHEFAHVSHGDHLIGHLQRLAAAFYWWNPLVYVVSRDLTTAMEEVCDNHAVLETGAPRRYVECLVHLAEKSCRISGLPGLFGLRHHKKNLEERIKNLLSRERDMKTSLSPKVGLILMLSFLLILGFASGARVVFEQDQPQVVEDPILSEGEEKRGSATQKAVEMALDWLKRHQDPEGFWDCDGFVLRCKDSPCKGKGMALNDVGATGLALLAFLGSGNTPASGPYKQTVKRGIKFLCDVQNPDDGCLTQKESVHYMYNHGVATLALVEAYGLSQWLPLKKPATQAIEFIHKSKNPGKAWRYNIGSTDPVEMNDVSVTGWMVMCLVSAKDFGLPVELSDIREALLYIDEMTETETGRTGYRSRGSWSSREMGDEQIWPFGSVEAMTGVGMLCRIFGGNLLGDLKARANILEKSASLLRAKLPKWDPKAGTIDFYYWYYGTYAMFQMGGEDWSTWKSYLIKALLDHQCTSGCEKGSWDPRYGPWGDNGGRTYSTALGALCLEVCARYDHLFKSLGATKEDPSGEEEQDQDEEQEMSIITDRLILESSGDERSLKLVVGGNQKKYLARFAKKGRAPSQIAVEQGLEWLKNHQDPGGFWDCDGFEVHCKDTRCDGKGMALNDVGVTGLALLAFLGGGHTLEQGSYKGVVKKGIKYLCDVQDPEDGCLTAKTGQHYMYNHGIAALALIESYGLCEWPPLKEPVERALAFIHQSKNPGKAWRYNMGATDPIQANDMSVTAWMVMCLATAQDFILEVDEQDLTDALKYIDDLTDPTTGRTGYQIKGSYSSREEGDHVAWPFDTVEALTGAGMLCRIFIHGSREGMVSQTEALQKGARLLMARLPTWDVEGGTIDYHHWYYGSYALFQMAGQDWKVWSDQLVKTLVENQRTDGHARGSWDPQKDPWGNSGGRVYSTALCVLTLEVFYRYRNILYAR
jgi:beta-lactamase regulating signal transducer with metallopeptidase domain